MPPVSRCLLMLVPLDFFVFSYRINDLWLHDAGNTNRIADIVYTLEHLEGRFRAIRVEPDKSALPERIIAKVHPIRHLEWESTDFDPATGECAGHSYPEERLFELI